MFLIDQQNIVVAIADSITIDNNSYVVDGTLYPYSLGVILIAEDVPEHVTPQNFKYQNGQFVFIAPKKALHRIDGHCSAAIQSGVVVDGKHYGLSVAMGQVNLANALTKADKGENPIPFSAIGDNKPSPYTPEQIKVIAKAADDWGIVNTTYYGYLKDWIARETDVDILNNIEYGATLPDDLMQALGTDLAKFGIDITKYATMLGGK